MHTTEHCTSYHTQFYTRHEFYLQAAPTYIATTDHEDVEDSMMAVDQATKLTGLNHSTINSVVSDWPSESS